MSTSINHTLSASVIEYSAKLAKNSLLVQGAGGNVSWKMGDTLWVKASGTWLLDAECRDIFTPLSLSKVRMLIEYDEDDFSPAILLPETLRPSIETSLHALLPQPVVVHLHAVDVIAHAVQQHAFANLTNCLAGLNWLWLNYVTPGLKLTKKIAANLDRHAPPDIIVLGNHGLIIAGNSVEQVDALLQDVLLRCQMIPRAVNITVNDKLDAEWQAMGYQLAADSSLHALAVDPICLALAEHKWVMYPDHAIFLNANAVVKKDDLDPQSFLKNLSHRPPCILIPGQGVIVSQNLTLGQEVMLRCYLDVTLRIDQPEQVIGLSRGEINELLHWDAEKYRQMMEKVQ